MGEGIKVGGVWFSLCVPNNEGFMEFEYLKSAFNLAHLKKALLLGCRGKISPLVRVNYSIIIKF
ncbi:hypothetical protein HpCK102_08040 [Helicobacter pylori]